MRKAVNDPVYRHRLVQLLVDAGLVALAYWLAYALRFDQGIPDRYSDLLWQTIAFVVVLPLLLFLRVKRTETAAHVEMPSE